jgi:hypothetical protein
MEDKQNNNKKAIEPIKLKKVKKGHLFILLIEGNQLYRKENVSKGSAFIRPVEIIINDRDGSLMIEEGDLASISLKAGVLPVDISGKRKKKKSQKKKKKKK